MLAESQKIQIWTNERGTEYALGLSNRPGEFKAMSDPGAVYIQLVEEVDYYPDMQYYWKFTLGHWMDIRNGKVKLGAEEPSGRTDNYLLESDFPQRVNPKRIGAGVVKPKGLVKCRFCDLWYDTVKERTEHEKEWHADKMKKV
jgi:hypothetical protein